MVDGFVATHVGTRSKIFAQPLGDTFVYSSTLLAGGLSGSR